MSAHTHRLAFNVNDAAKASGLSVVVIEAAVRYGELKAHQIGTRTIVLADDLASWIIAAPLPGAPASTSEAPSPESVTALLNTERAAKYLGLGISTLERHRCLGTGPRFLRLGNGKSVRYRLKDLDDWASTLLSTSEDALAGGRHER